MTSRAKEPLPPRSVPSGIEASRPEPTPSSLYVTPDQGWAWLILVASFTCQVLGGGVTYSFGVLFLELLDYFGESRTLTAWVGSVFGGMSTLIGPISSLVIGRCGCKVTTIIGGVLGSLGLVLSTLSPNIYFMMLTYSVLGGSGIVLTYVASFIIITNVFVKHRAVATGIVSSGIGVGTFVFPPFYALMNQIYFWKGSMWIMAGVLLNCCVLGSFYREPPSRQQLNDKESLLNVAILKKPACILVCVTGILGLIGYFVPFIFITDLLESQGKERSKGAILLSIMGLSNMAGRVLSGIIINCGWVKASILYMAGFLMGGFPTLIVPWIQHFPLLCGYSVCLGISYGASITVGTIILQEHFGPENISSSVGFLSLFRGAGTIISGPFAGLLYRWTGSHTCMFTTAGLLLILAAVVASPLYRVQTWNPLSTNGDKMEELTAIHDATRTSQTSLTLYHNQ